MPTIYVVTEGEYSNYHILGVYSEKKTADARAEVSGGVVEEYELNEDADLLRQGLWTYRVTMARDGEVIRCTRRDEEEVSDEWCFTPRTENYSHRGMHVYVTVTRREYKGCIVVVAKDQQHAVKIANEKRARCIAENKWPTWSDGDDEKYRQERRHYVASSFYYVVLSPDEPVPTLEELLATAGLQ